MPRFIAIPKENTALSMLSMAEITCSRKARAKQIKKLKKFRKDVDGALARVKRVTGVLKDFSAEILVHPAKATPITGITILKGKLEELTDLQNAMPDHDIIEDAPLTLVLPTKTGPTLS